MMLPFELVPPPPKSESVSRPRTASALKSLVDITKLPLTLVLGRAIFEANRPTGVIFVDCLVLNIVTKQQRRVTKHFEAEVSEEFQFLIIIEVGIGDGVKTVAEKVIIITKV